MKENCFTPIHRCDGPLGRIKCAALVWMVAFAANCWRPALGHEALVISIDHYASLPDAAANGATHDAEQVAGALSAVARTYVQRNEEATKAAILSLLAEWRETISPDEDIFFHFAGFGGRSTLGEPVLLPADAREDGANDLSLSELNEALCAIPARSRLVTIDAGFVGAEKKAGKAANAITRFQARSIPALSRDAGKQRQLILGQVAEEGVLLPPFSLPKNAPPIVYLTTFGWNEAASDKKEQELMSRQLIAFFESLVAPINSVSRSIPALSRNGFETRDNGYNGKVVRACIFSRCGQVERPALAAFRCRRSGLERFAGGVGKRKSRFHGSHRFKPKASARFSQRSERGADAVRVGTNSAVVRHRIETAGASLSRGGPRTRPGGN